jgi:hypothetical protein
MREEKSLDERSGEREFDAQEVRRRRIERLEKSDTTSDVEVEEVKMDEESNAPRESLRSDRSHRRREHRSGEERIHHRQRKSEQRDDAEYVYGRPTERSHPRVTEERRIETTDEEDHVEPVREKRRKEKKIRIVYVTKEEMKSGKYKERRSRTGKESADRPKTPTESIRRSRGGLTSRRQSAPEATPPSPLKRSSRHLPEERRPALERSNTTTSQTPPANISTRRGSFFGGLLRPTPQLPREPERL